MRSGSVTNLDERVAGEAGNIKLTVASATVQGVTGKLSFNLPADPNAASQQLYSINGATQKHEFTGSVHMRDALTVKGHLTGKNTGVGASNISGFDSLSIFGNATLGNNGNESHTLKGSTTFEGTAGQLVLSELPLSASSFISQTHITASGDIKAGGEISASAFLDGNRKFTSAPTGIDSAGPKGDIVYFGGGTVAQGRVYYWN